MNETPIPSRFSPRAAASWALPILLFVLLAVPGGLRQAISLTKKITTALEVWESGTPLTGSTVPAALPTFHLRDWLSGDFQAKYALWFGQNFSLRSNMVRIDNQIGYTIFRKSNNSSVNVVVGRNKFLYEGSYVTEYCDTDLAPAPSDAELENLARDLADVGARLRARGVGFVLYISPSKAAIYPENLPDAFARQKTGRPRTYDRILGLLKQYHVVYIDGHKILAEAKAQEADLPLFCRGGTHYSQMGMYYVARTLFPALEKEARKPFPPLRCPLPVPVDYHPGDDDDDLAKLMNVSFPPTYFLSPHPALTFDWTNTKPGAAGKLSVVGSSFCWHPLRLLEKHHVYEKMDFYYYYRTDLYRYPGGVKTPIDVAKWDWDTTLLKSDVILLDINEQSLHDPGDTHFRAFLRDAKRKLPPVEKSAPQN